MTTFLIFCLEWLLINSIKFHLKNELKAIQCLDIWLGAGFLVPDLYGADLSHRALGIQMINWQEN